MKLVQYSIAELDQFISSNGFLNFDVIPITPNRVESQILNPKASKEDVVLTVAFSEENKILGYIGALPDVVNGVRCAWNSCWWVKPGVPAQVSMKLLASFISGWNKMVLFSEMTPHTSSIIKSLGFCKHITVQGLRGYSRFSLADILPGKRKSLQQFVFIFKILDAIINLFLGIYYSLVIKKKETDFSVSENLYLDESDQLFIEKCNKLQPAKRSVSDFNWINQHRWVISDDSASDTISKGYYFSYKVKRFESGWVKFSRNNKVEALVNYTIRNKELKLPYLFCDNEMSEVVGNYFYLKLISDRKLSNITTFHRGLSEYLALNKKFLFKSRLPKYSAISNELFRKAGLENIEFQMGDGDCVFT